MLLVGSMETFSLWYLCGFSLVFLRLLAWCQGVTWQDSVTVLQYKQNWAFMLLPLCSVLGTPKKARVM